jgi:hypothetical protein
LRKHVVLEHFVKWFLGHFFDVGPRRKSFVAGPRDDNAFDTGVLVVLTCDDVQFVDQSIVQGVQCFGTIECDDTNCTDLFGNEKFMGGRGGKTTAAKGLDGSGDGSVDHRVKGWKNEASQLQLLPPHS